MNTGKHKYRWWEFPQYIAVTLLFVIPGALVVLLKFCKLIWRIISWPARRLVRLAITLLFCLLIGGGAGFYLFARPVELGSRTVTVIIKPGDNLAQVATRLRAEGVIRLRAALVYPAQWLGLDKRLSSGRYDFTGTVSLLSVIRKLQFSDFVRVKVTVYEGAPIWKVAGILARSLQIDSAAVMRLTSDSAFLRSLGIPHLEGYLFPETYVVPWGTPVDQVLKEMVGMFRAQTDSLWSTPLPARMTKDDILTLASIVQAEIKLDSELTKVSAVYHNRLRIRMHLDADPTVIYGLGGIRRPLDRFDLKKPNRYNTYLNYGLPPTPINSPGLAAIRAALRPDTNNYLYFVADGTGGHRFSRTNEEHNTARKEIRRAQRLNQKS